MGETFIPKMFHSNRDASFTFILFEKQYSFIEYNFCIRFKIVCLSNIWVLRSFMFNENESLNDFRFYFSNPTQILKEKSTFNIQNIILAIIEHEQ